MKSLVVLPLVSLTALLSPACTTLSDGTRVPNDAVITGIAYTTTFGAFAALAPAKRAQLAPYVSAIAKDIRALSGGAPPTSDEINATIALWKSPDPVLTTAVKGLAGLYASYYPSIKGNPAQVLKVLNDIASGVDVAAAALQ